MARDALPFNYLGVLLFSGRAKNIYSDPVIDKVRRAVDRWKAKLLSFVGRLTLIKTVLASYPIYAMASTIVPSGATKY